MHRYQTALPADKELAILRQVREIVKAAVAVPCTACAYCVDGCPMQIPIPRYFSLFNEHKRDKWQANAIDRYAKMAKTHTKASACIGNRIERQNTIPYQEERKASEKTNEQKKELQFLGIPSDILQPTFSDRLADDNPGSTG